MDRPYVDRFWDNQLDSDCEGAPDAAPVPIPSPAEHAPPSMPAASPRPPLCASYQHPSRVPPVGWVSLGCWEEVRFGAGEVAAGSGGAASSSSGGMGTGVGTGVSAVAAPSVVVVVEDDDEADGGDVPISIAASANASASPLEFWIQRIGARMAAADAFVRGNADRMRWQLPPPGASIVDHAIGMINDTLGQGYVRVFYIGLTAELGRRWDGDPNPIAGRKPMQGHKVKYQKIVIVGCSDHDDEIGDAEISVIARFRRHDRNGICNINGDFRCDNRNPGGEGARGGTPPHLLYVCWSWNPRR